MNKILKLQALDQTYSKKRSSLLPSVLEPRKSTLSFFC
nr:hypothetical protein [Lentilactobacillus parabuchneri]